MKEKKNRDVNTNELSDEQLEQVIGGIGIIPNVSAQGATSYPGSGGILGQENPPTIVNCSNSGKVTK